MKLFGCVLMAGQFVIALQPTIAGEDPIRLLYKPQAHTTARYEAVSTVLQKMTVPKRSIETEATTALSFDLGVTESLLSRTTMNFNLSRATVQLIMRGVESPSSPKIEEIDDVAGKTAAITITPDGNEISNTIDTSRGPIEAFTELLSSTKILQRLFMPLSATDVVPGSTWKQQLVDTIESPQRMGAIVTTGAIAVSYKGMLDTLDKDCWVIETVGDDLVQTGSYSSGATNMTLNGKGTFRGWALLDSKTGLTLRSNYSLSTKANMELKGAHSMEMPVEYNVRLVIEQKSDGSR